jgi:hypothetical protein
MKLVFVTVFALIVAVSARGIDTDEQVVDIQDYDDCKANTYYSRSGAECVCDYQGHQLCETYEEHYKRINCTPGVSFNDGCNTCGCGKNGEVTFCTMMACFRQPKYCKRGNTHQIGAKACKCNDQGELYCA